MYCAQLALACQQRMSLHPAWSLSNNTGKLYCEPLSPIPLHHSMPQGLPCCRLHADTVEGVVKLQAVGLLDELPASDPELQEYPSEAVGPTAPHIAIARYDISNIPLHSSCDSTGLLKITGRLAP